MRALKVLVIAMGVLLLGGIVALVVAVTARVEGRRAAALPQSAAPLHESLPAGARVLAAELSGDRLMLRVALADGGERILLYDAHSGGLIAAIDASTKP